MIDRQLLHTHCFHNIFVSIIFGIQALDQSESFQLFGLDIAVSKANWTPVIFSGVILAAGLILMISSRKSTTR